MYSGKTTFLQMLSIAFPQWVKIPNVEHFTIARNGKSDADAASPSKMDWMGTRILGPEEPQPGAVFDGALFKNVRGGGNVTGRPLYGQNVTYKPTYVLFVVSNAPIEIKPMDQAVLNSIHAFKLPSTFVNEGDPRLTDGTPYVYPKIGDLVQRMYDRKYKLALFYILKDFYDMYKRDGLDSCTSAYDMRSIYREEHGMTDEQWFDEYFEVAPDGMERLTTRGIHSVLEQNGYKGGEKQIRAWLKAKFGDKDSPNKVPGVSVVNHHGSNKWKGIGFKTVQF
jgi:phage/plasmid-associated DNA primase